MGAEGRSGFGGGVVLGIVAVVLVGALVIGAFVLGRSSDDDDAASGDRPAATTTEPSRDLSGRKATTTSTVPASTTTTVVAPPTTARPGVIGDVLDQPSGLLCRDLEARGFSYRAAVEYWFNDGQPDRMDEDLNGIPCETVYSTRDVEAYWGPIDSGFDAPSGLLCRDLADRGYNYAEAVDYWFAEGTPDRMDADRNGIPCETVYPSSDVEAYWGPGG